MTLHTLDLPLWWQGSTHSISRFIVLVDGDFLIVSTLSFIFKIHSCRPSSLMWPSSLSTYPSCPFSQQGNTRVLCLARNYGNKVLNGIETIGCFYFLPHSLETKTIIGFQLCCKITFTLHKTRMFGGRARKVLCFLKRKHFLRRFSGPAERRARDRPRASWRD